MTALGRLAAPYPQDDCANVDCERRLDDAEGAFLYKDLESGKLVVFCDDCARYVELERPDRFKLVAL